MRIYLSSTWEDLKEYREAVSRGLRSLGHDVAGMDSDTRPPLERTMEDVSASDVYVGIVAHRYGHVPESEDNPEGLSITELEYRRAKSLRLPCLVFLLSGETPWPPKFFDEGESLRKVSAFRVRLAREGGVTTFSRPDELASLAVAAIARIASQKFDAFLSYNQEDRAAVGELAARLKRDGIRVWWDEKGLKPGDDWDQETRRAFANSDAVVVVVGPGGIGEGQDHEVELALERKAREGDHFSLITVILPKAGAELVPPALTRFSWINFGDSLGNPAAHDMLRAAISGKSTDSPVESARAGQALEERDLRMLPELLFRLVARLRERPEMLQSLEATAFWAAARKIRPESATLEDLRSIHEQLAGEPPPGPLWAAWLRNTRAAELAAILQHPDRSRQQ